MKCKEKISIISEIIFRASSYKKRISDDKEKVKQDCINDSKEKLEMLSRELYHKGIVSNRYIKDHDMVLFTAPVIGEDELQQYRSYQTTTRDVNKNYLTFDCHLMHPDTTERIKYEAANRIAQKLIDGDYLCASFDESRRNITFSINAF